LDWKWAEATEDKQYDMKAQLLSSSDNVISESGVKTVKAPEANINFSLSSSTATQPTSQPSAVQGEYAEISGKVVINGPVKNNSTVLILQRLPGTEKWLEIERVAAKTDTTFIWTKAIEGQRYELVATLQENEQSVATSDELTAVAPSNSVVFTIDSNLRLEAPSSAPQVSCGSADANNNFNAKVIAPNVENALAYYIEVGNSPESSDVAKQGMQATDVEASLNAYAVNGQTYYARYSYTYCTDCDTYNRQNWAPFSPTLAFKCPQ
jgi:hypothetical protein